MEIQTCIRRIIASILLLLLIEIVGCTSAVKRPTSSPEELYGPQLSPGLLERPKTLVSPSPLPTEPFSIPTPYGPQPKTVLPITLVFTPGLARGFAFVGALRALHEARIPIAAIFSTEFGSLVAALYGREGKVNSMEWDILHFKNDWFVEKRGFFASKFFSVQRRTRNFESALEKVFESWDLSQSKVPLRISVQPENSAKQILLDRGEMSVAVRAALNVSGLFEPVSWHGTRVKGAVDTWMQLIGEARAFGRGPVIVIDVRESTAGGGGDESIFELPSESLVIRPDLRGISAMDFHKRTDIAFLGRRAVIERIGDIRRLIGIEGGESR